jgi:hypothetical protein
VCHPFLSEQLWSGKEKITHHQHSACVNGNMLLIFKQGCGAGTGTGTGRNRIHLGTLEPEPEPYSEYGSGSGSGYKEMEQKTQKNLLEV